MACAQVNLRFGVRPKAFSTPPGLRPKARRQLPSPSAEHARVALPTAWPVSNRSRISVRSVGKLIRRGTVCVIVNS